MVNEGSQARGATDLELPEWGKVWGPTVWSQSFQVKGAVVYCQEG